MIMEKVIIGRGWSLAPGAGGSTKKSAAKSQIVGYINIIIGAACTRADTYCSQSQIDEPVVFADFAFELLQLQK